MQPIFFIFWACFGLLATAAPFQTQVSSSTIDYDAIVVGGGPGGLGSLSALGRIRRKALLIDSGEYRNGPTRHMHDVAGFDGVTPAYFRWVARKQISYYSTVNSMNGTVTRIIPEANHAYFTVEVLPANDAPAVTYTARKIVLGTGLRDLLPATPGIAENFGKGIYWCPWCDGMEHADQALGVLGSFDQLIDAAAEVTLLNRDVVIFANGTDTPANRALAAKQFAGDAEAYLARRNIRVENRTIARITRLRDGAAPGADPAVPTAPELDLFRVEWVDGSPAVERAVFFTVFPNEQRSLLGPRMGVELAAGKMLVDRNMRTSVPGVYAVGDAGSDQATNVLHALYTGKLAAVDLHRQLERELSMAPVPLGVDGTRIAWEENHLLGADLTRNKGPLSLSATEPQTVLSKEVHNT